MLIPYFPRYVVLSPHWHFAFHVVLSVEGSVQVLSVEGQHYPPDILLTSVICHLASEAVSQSLLPSGSLFFGFLLGLRWWQGELLFPVIGEGPKRRWYLSGSNHGVEKFTWSGLSSYISTFYSPIYFKDLFSLATFHQVRFKRLN